MGCGLWPGLDCGKKRSGPILSNFLGWFFHFFGVKKKLKNFFENIIASALKSYIIFFFFKWSEKVKKTGFFRAKNATVTTKRSETDYCWLYCGLNWLDF